MWDDACRRGAAGILFLLAGVRAVLCVTGPGACPARDRKRTTVQYWFVRESSEATAMTYEVHVSGHVAPVTFDRLSAADAYRRQIVSGGTFAWMRSS